MKMNNIERNHQKAKIKQDKQHKGIVTADENVIPQQEDFNNDKYVSNSNWA